MESSSGSTNSPIAWLTSPIILMEVMADQLKAEVNCLLNNYVLKFESDMIRHSEIQSLISKAVVKKLENTVKTNVTKMQQLLDEVYEELTNRFDSSLSSSVGLPCEPGPSEETKQAVLEALKKLEANKTEEDDFSGKQVENEPAEIVYFLDSDSDEDDDNHPNQRESYHVSELNRSLQDISEESCDSLVEDLLARERILAFRIESDEESDEEEEQTEGEEQVVGVKRKREVNGGMPGYQAVEPFHFCNELADEKVIVKQETNFGAMADFTIIDDDDESIDMDCVVVIDSDIDDD